MVMMVVPLMRGATTRQCIRHADCPCCWLTDLSTNEHGLIAGLHTFCLSKLEIKRGELVYLVRNLLSDNSILLCNKNIDP